jgi:hypothetical protein
LCLLTEDTDNPIIIRPHIVLTDGRPICGRIMIELSLLPSVSKHTIWSYYDWVHCCCRPSVNTICGRIIITDGNNDNSIIIRPHIVFTDRRQQRQPNHNTNTYCVTMCGRIMIGLSLLSSVIKHTMWSYYDWVVVVVVRQ